MSSICSPLEIVESVAEDIAPDARVRRLQAISFCDPEVPSSVRCDAKIVKDALRILAREALKKIDGSKEGSVIVEALLGKNQGRQTIRFGVSDTRTMLSIDEVNREAKHLEENVLGDWVRQLNCLIEPDIDLLGRATRFSLSVPLLRAKVEPDEPVMSEKLAKMRMFLVANDPAPNRTIPHYARHAGLDIDGAPTASETIVAIGRAIDQPFHILLVAPPIEDMSAVEIAKAIRQSDMHHMKLLYVAPWDDPSDRLNHMECGFDDTIAKPFTKRQLFDALQRLAGRIPKKAEKGPVVLIVEDNPINAQLAAFRVKKLGFEAEIVSNGREALQAIEQNMFAAVLMDLQMPVMDGLQATKEIRSREKGGCRTPIIALTANEEWRDQAIEAGCDGFLAKPVRQDHLKQMLTKYVQKTGENVR